MKNSMSILIAFLIGVFGAKIFTDLSSQPAFAQSMESEIVGNPYSMFYAKNESNGSIYAATFDHSTGTSTLGANVWQNGLEPSPLGRFQIVADAKGGCYVLDTMTGETWRSDNKGYVHIIVQP